MRSITRSLITATAIATALAFASTAGAIAPDPQIIVPVEVEVGSTFIVSGSGFCSEVDVVLTLDTDPETTLATVLTEPDELNFGGFVTEVTAPNTPGSFTLTATDEECSLTATGPIVITAPEETTTTVEDTTTTSVEDTTTTSVEPLAPAPTTTVVPVTGLPATGSSDGVISIAAVLALLAGAGLVAAARRPRTS